MNPFQQWACTRIQKILALESADAAEEIVNYASQVSSKSELESYFKSLLGNTPQTLDFIQQFWERNEKEKSTPQTVATPKQQAATIPEGYKLYKKNEYSANENEDEDVDENESSQTKKQKKQRKRHQKTSNVIVYRNPYKLTGPQVLMKIKKKKEPSGQTHSQAYRIPCNCQAREHPLVNNCIRCGKIVCAQEGPGACLFCGSPVLSKNATPEEIQRVQDSVRDNKMNAREREGLQKAEEHKNKLLEYERNSTKRTLVYDDQVDYFDLNKWTTPQEKEEIQRRLEQLKRQQEDARKKITIDIAGRRIICSDENDEDEYRRFQEEILQMTQQTKREENDVSSQRHSQSAEQNKDNADENRRGFFYNPHVELHPLFVTKPDASGSANKENQSKSSPSKKAIAPLKSSSTTNRKRTARVQHEFFPEVSLATHSETQ